MTAAPGPEGEGAARRPRSMPPLYERALRAYLGALGAVDPVRIQFWDFRGLTISQLRLLFLVRDMGEPSLGDLAGQMMVRPATLTGLAERLIAQGLVVREHDQRDKRVVRLCLSDEGRRVTEEISAAGRAFVRAVFEEMAPERLEAFATSLEEFAAAAAKVSCRAAALDEADSGPGAP